MRVRSGPWAEEIVPPFADDICDIRETIHDTTSLGNSGSDDRSSCGCSFTSNFTRPTPAERGPVRRVRDHSDCWFTAGRGPCQRFGYRPNREVHGLLGIDLARAPTWP